MLPLIPIPFPGLLIRATSYLFSSVLKRYYTPQTLSDLVDIKVSSEPEGFKVTCSELPRATGWVEINNLSPFHLTVLEFEVDLYLSARVARYLRIRDLEIKSGTAERLFVETDLTNKQVTYIRKHKKGGAPTLKVSCLLSCRLAKFEILDRELLVEDIHFVDCGDSWRRIIH